MRKTLSPLLRHSLMTAIHITQYAVNMQPVTTATATVCTSSSTSFLYIAKYKLLKLNFFAYVREKMHLTKYK